MALKNKPQTYNCNKMNQVLWSPPNHVTIQIAMPHPCLCLAPPLRLWIGRRALIRVSLTVSFFTRSAMLRCVPTASAWSLSLHVAEDKKPLDIESLWRAGAQTSCSWLQFRGSPSKGSVGVEGLVWRWEAKFWWSSCLSEARQGELLHVLVFQLRLRHIPLHPFLECNRDGARKGHMLLLAVVLLLLFRFGAQLTRAGACLAAGARQRLDHISGYWWTLDWFLKPFPKSTPNYFAFHEEQNCHPCTIKVLSVWNEQLLWFEGGQGGIQGWIELFGKVSPEGLPRFDLTSMWMWYVNLVKQGFPLKLDSASDGWKLFIDIVLMMCNHYRCKQLSKLFRPLMIWLKSAKCLCWWISMQPGTTLSFVPQRCPNFRFIMHNANYKEDVVE